MPDWEEINKRLREEEKSLSEETKIPGDTDPRTEGWTAHTARIQKESEARENARRNEPGMLKFKWTIKFHSMFGWFSKEARAERKKAKSNKQNEN